MGNRAAPAPPTVSMRLPEPRGTADRGTGNRGTGVTDAAAQARSEAAEQRRRASLDDFRAGLTPRVAKEELAKDSVDVLLVRLNGALNAFQEAPGPRSEYAAAVNLLALYVELSQRVPGSPRDEDGALMMRDYRQLPVPWTRDRPKRLEDIRGVDAASVARYNAVVANGQPPREAPTRSGRAKPPSYTPSDDSIAPPPPALQMQRGPELPFGMTAIVHPGGPDARIIYTILKTPEMNTTSEEGRIAILEAVIARILAPKVDESYAPVAARALVDAAHERLATGADVVKSAEPGAFEKRRPGTSFTFEVGLTFLMNLDDVTDGAVAMELINQLEAHVEIKQEEDPPLWREVLPRATLKERAYWLHKRSLGAREFRDRDPKLFPLYPGIFYVDRGMTFVAYGNTAADQVWCTRDLRIWEVNERALLLEAFRQGVLRAAGGVALAYILISTSLLLIEGPAMLEMVAQLRFPAQVARTFVTLLRTQPLKVLGQLAIDQGANVILSGGWDNYVDSLGKPEGWFNMLFSVLGVTHTKLQFPDGSHVEVMPRGSGEYEFHLVEGPTGEGAALETQVFPETEVVAAMPVAETTPAKARPSSADEGAQVVLRDAPASSVKEVSPSPAPDAPSLGSEITEPHATRESVRGTAERGTQEPSTGKATEAPKEGELPKAVDRSKPAANDNAPPAANENVAEAVMSDEAALNLEGVQQEDVPVALEGAGGMVAGKPPSRSGGRNPPPPPPRQQKGIGNTGVSGNARGTAGKTAPAPPVRTPVRLVNGEIQFTRDGIEFHFSTDAAAEGRFNAIPPGDTVVYTFHDADGNVVYSGITTKREVGTKFRDALSRAQEHMRDKPGEFVGTVVEFRIRGHYMTEREAAALEFSLIRDSEAGTQTVFNRDRATWKTYTEGYRHDRWRPEGADADMRVGSDYRDEPFVPDVEPNIPKEMTRPIRFDINDL